MRLRFDGALGTMIVRGTGMAANLGMLALVGRTAGGEALGAVLAINAVAFLGGAVFSLGMPTLLLKTMVGELFLGRRERAAQEYRDAHQCVLGISAAVAAIGILIWFLGGDRRIPLLGDLSPSIFGAALFNAAAASVHFVALSGVRALKRPVLSGLLQFNLQPLMMMAFVGTTWIIAGSLSVENCVFGISCSALITAWVSHRFAWSPLRGEQTVKRQFARFGEAKSFWFLTILNAAAANLPIVLGTLFLPVAIIPVFAVPFRICNLPMTVVAAMGAHYAPMLHEAHAAKDWVRLNRELHESQLIGAAFSLPLLVAALVAPDAILGLFGIASPLAKPIFLILALTQVFVASCGVAEQCLAMTDRQRLASKITAMSVAITTLIAALATPQWGPVALAVAWALPALARQGVMRHHCTSRKSRTAVERLV